MVKRPTICLCSVSSLFSSLCSDIYSFHVARIPGKSGEMRVSTGHRTVWKETRKKERGTRDTRCFVAQLPTTKGTRRQVEPENECQPRVPLRPSSGDFIHLPSTYPSYLRSFRYSLSYALYRTLPRYVLCPFKWKFVSNRWNCNRSKAEFSGLAIIQQITRGNHLSGFLGDRNGRGR